MADIDADRYLGPRRSFQLEDVREMDVKIVDKALHSCNIVPVSHEPNNDRSGRPRLQSMQLSLKNVGSWILRHDEEEDHPSIRKCTCSDEHDASTSLHLVSDIDTILQLGNGSVSVDKAWSSGKLHLSPTVLETTEDDDAVSIDEEWKAMSISSEDRRVAVEAWLPFLKRLGKAMPADIRHVASDEDKSRVQIGPLLSEVHLNISIVNEEERSYAKEFFTIYFIQVVAVGTNITSYRSDHNRDVVWTVEKRFSECRTLYRKLQRAKRKGSTHRTNSLSEDALTLREDYTFDLQISEESLGSMSSSSALLPFGNESIIDNSDYEEESDLGDITRRSSRESFSRSTTPPDTLEQEDNLKARNNSTSVSGALSRIPSLSKVRSETLKSPSFPGRLLRHTRPNLIKRRAKLENWLMHVASKYSDNIDVQKFFRVSESIHAHRLAMMTSEKQTFAGEPNDNDASPTKIISKEESTSFALNEESRSHRTESADRTLASHEPGLEAVAKEIDNAESKEKDKSSPIPVDLDSCIQEKAHDFSLLLPSKWSLSRFLMSTIFLSIIFFFSHAWIQSYRLQIPNTNANTEANGAIPMPIPMRDKFISDPLSTKTAYHTRKVKTAMNEKSDICFFNCLHK